MHTFNLKTDKRKIFIVFIVIIAFIRICYVWHDYGIEEEYYCSSSDTVPIMTGQYPLNLITQDFVSDKKYLNSLELLFGEVKVESTVGITLKVYNKDKIIYQSGIPVSTLQNNTWYKIYLNIPLSGNLYRIELASDGKGEVPLIYTASDENTAPENRGCIINGERQNGQLVIRYGYLKSISVADKCLGTFTTMLIMILAIYIVFYFKKILLHLKESSYKILKHFKGYLKYIFVVVEIGFCYILIEDAGIEFQIPVKVVLYAISLLTYTGYKYISDFMQNQLEKNCEKLQFITVVIFSAFAFTGNRMFIYPLDMKVNGLKILIFIIAVFWFIPVVALFLEWYRNLGLKLNSYTHKEGGLKLSRCKFIILIICLLLVPAFYALYAFNPGISSSDTETCLADIAHNIRGMKNWHPPVYCMFLKAIISVWDSTYAVVLVQFFFFAYVVLEGMLMLEKRGASQKFILLITFLIGINPANYIHLCTIWKDVPYSISVMWLTIIIARICLDSTASRKWYIYFEFIIASVFVFFMRQNGMVVYILTMLFCIYVLRKNKRIILSAVISFIFILIIRFPLYSYIGVQESGGGIYIGLSQDILGVYYAGGNLSEESMEMVNVLTENNTGQFEYNPYFAISSYDLDISITAFIRNYLDTFIHNPVIMLREIICRQDCIWDIFGGEEALLGCVNYTNTQDATGDIWNNFYPKRVTNAYTYKLLDYQGYIINNQLLNLISWKTGIYTLLVVFAFLSLLYKKTDKKLLLIFVPFAGQVLSLILSTGWSEFRYYLPLNLIAVFVVILIPTVKGQERSF